MKKSEIHRNKMLKEKMIDSLVSTGMTKTQATKTTRELYNNSSKVMFLAIAWGIAKFGNPVVLNVTEVEDTMENGKFGALNEFQAVAKLSHTRPAV